MKKIILSLLLIVTAVNCFSQSSLTDKKYFFSKNFLTAKSLVEIGLSKQNDRNNMLSYFILASSYDDKAKSLFDSLKPLLKIKLSQKEIKDTDSTLSIMRDLV